MVMMMMMIDDDDTCSRTGPCNGDQKFLKEKQMLVKVFSELKTNTCEIFCICFKLHLTTYLLIIILDKSPKIPKI